MVKTVKRVKRKKETYKGYSYFRDRKATADDADSVEDDLDHGHSSEEVEYSNPEDAPKIKVTWY